MMKQVNMCNLDSKKLASTTIETNGFPEVFRGLPHNLQADSKVLDQMVHDRFLQNNFQFIITILRYEILVFEVTFNDLMEE
jgi:hypothetical protein